MIINIPTQHHLIFKLESLRHVINKTVDKDMMIATARQACVLASTVPIDPAFSYKIEGRERTMSLLSHEIRSYEKSNTEIEVIQFQLSSTILMLMLQYIRGSLEDIEHVLAECRKVA